MQSNKQIHISRDRERGGERLDLRRQVCRERRGPGVGICDGRDRGRRIGLRGGSRGSPASIISPLSPPSQSCSDNYSSLASPSPPQLLPASIFFGLAPRLARTVGESLLSVFLGVLEPVLYILGVEHVFLFCILLEDVLLIFNLFLSFFF